MKILQFLRSNKTSAFYKRKSTVQKGNRCSSAFSGIIIILPTYTTNNCPSVSNNITSNGSLKRARRVTQSDLHIRKLEKPLIQIKYSLSWSASSISNCQYPWFASNFGNINGSPDESMHTSILGMVEKYRTETALKMLIRCRRAEIHPSLEQIS